MNPNKNLIPMKTTLNLYNVNNNFWALDIRYKYYKFNKVHTQLLSVVRFSSGQMSWLASVHVVVVRQKLVSCWQFLSSSLLLSSLIWSSLRYQDISVLNIWDISVLEISVLNNKNNLIEFKNFFKFYLHVDVVYFGTE